MAVISHLSTASPPRSLKPAWAMAQGQVPDPGSLLTYITQFEPQHLKTYIEAKSITEGIFTWKTEPTSNPNSDTNACDLSRSLHAIVSAESEMMVN